MKALLVRIEPIIWLLFGQGILIGTILLTAWILVIGLLIPLGIVPAEALSYERAYRLATAAPLGIPIGRLVLLAVMALPLWKGAHHVRSLLLDFGGHERDALVGSALYATAAVGSLVAVVAVFKL
jgi:fumarate reductase subunit D